MFSGHSVFHESYYAHYCPLESEKDVLYIQIPGNSLGARLKRWWFNMFLLSYRDVRCRMYFSSSQAMRSDRNRHYRFYRGRIHPMSKFSNFWNYFISIVVLINRVILSYSMALAFGDFPLFIYITSVFLEFIAIFDIYIQLKTGYIDKESRKIIFNAKSRFLQYASTKLFFHSISATPVQFIQILRYGSEISCILCKANRFICTLKFVSSFGLFRLYDSTTFWIREGRSFKVTYFFKFLRISFLGIFTITQYFTLTNTINLLLICQSGKIEEGSYFALLLRYRFWEKDITLTQYIIMDISKIIKSFFLFGYSYQTPFYLDKLFALIGDLIASLFILWGLTELYVVLSRLMFADDKMHSHRDRTLNMMKCMQLTDRVSEKVLDYYHYNMSRLIVIETTNEIHNSLPTSILKEIKVSAYSRLVKRISYFNEWPPTVIDDLVMILKEEVFLADDVVSHVWSTGEGLIIVETGVLAVYTADHVESGHLIDGDYFGVLSLVTDKEVRSSYVTATTRCKILILYKSDFRHYMQRHPDLFFTLRKRLRRHYKWEDTDEDVSLGPRHK